jgi:hypothetical protein
MHGGAKLISAGLTVALLAGCSTVNLRSDAIAGTAFQNSGLSARSQELLATVAAMKGATDAKILKATSDQLALDFSQVIAQCKDALASNDSRLNRSNDWALGVSIVGLLSGVGAASLAAKASASKSTIAALSGVAGGANSLQNQLKQTGYDPAEYSKRSTIIREAILQRTKEFQDGDLERRQGAMRDLISTCVAYS